MSVEVLIIGKSDLAYEIQHQLNGQATVVGRPEYDLLNQHDCDQLINDYNPSTVIQTAAVNEHGNTWEILSVNYVSAVYLTLGFYNKMPNGQIINISSSSSYWPSFPGITDGRLCYNISKESLSLFGKHFNRKIVDESKPTTVSTIELGSFVSKFNNNRGRMPLQKVANIVVSCITNPITAITCIK